MVGNATKTDINIIILENDCAEFTEETYTDSNDNSSSHFSEDILQNNNPYRVLNL